MAGMAGGDAMHTDASYSQFQFGRFPKKKSATS